jgi:PhnB protein
MNTFFAPHLTVKDVRGAIEFYKNAFDAVELKRVDNPDGSVHVAELTIDGALLHLHDEVKRDAQLSPITLQGTTSMIGMFVDDPHAVVRKAIESGAQETSPVQDYDYGYRQGVVTDPAGHQWLIQKKI